MKVTSLKIPEIKIIQPQIFKDNRGLFLEFFNQKKFFNLIGIKDPFVQDNISISHKGALRGLHYQIAPFEQSKLISVISGKIFDVAVDIRPKSDTYGQWVGETLSSENRKQIYIPKGFAHGFLALTDNTIIIYKTNSSYSSKSERCISYDDKKLNISWPKMDKYLISKKDSLGHKLIK